MFSFYSMSRAAQWYHISLMFGSYWVQIKAGGWLPWQVFLWSSSWMSWHYVKIGHHYFLPCISQFINHNTTNNNNPINNRWKFLLPPLHKVWENQRIASLQKPEMGRQTCLPLQISPYHHMRDLAEGCALLACSLEGVCNSDTQQRPLKTK
jgi:hypothetical protein